MRRNDDEEETKRRRRREELGKALDTRVDACAGQSVSVERGRDRSRAGPDPIGCVIERMSKAWGRTVIPLPLRRMGWIRIGKVAHGLGEEAGRQGLLRRSHSLAK